MPDACAKGILASSAIKSVPAIAPIAVAIYIAPYVRSGMIWNSGCPASS